MMNGKDLEGWALEQKTYQKLKRTEREIIIRELVSTLIMVEINKEVTD